MPLWMQLLINGGILKNPTNGEGDDLGGGSDNNPSDSPNDNANNNPDADPSDADPSDVPNDDNSDDASKGNKKKITDKEAELLKEVMKNKQEKQRLKDQLEKYANIDPEEAKAAIAAKKAQETKALEEKGEYDRVKQSMAAQHLQEVEQLNTQIAQLQERLNERDGQVSELTVGSSFAKSTYISSELTLTPNKARALYGSHFEIENGEVIGYDKPRGSTNRTQLVDGYGNPLSFDKAIEKIIEADPERDTLIRSKINPGSGSRNKQNNNSPKNDKPMSTLDKIAAGLQKNQT